MQQMNTRFEACNEVEFSLHQWLIMNNGHVVMCYVFVSNAQMLFYKRCQTRKHVAGTPLLNFALRLACQAAVFKVVPPQRSLHQSK